MNITITQDQVLSLVRTAMVILGTFLVTNNQNNSGYFSPTDWETITGTVTIVIPIIWSMIAHAREKSTRVLAGSTK